MPKAILMKRMEFLNISYKVLYNIFQLAFIGQVNLYLKYFLEV